VAPQTGDYTFWISSDDNSELSVSTDQNAVNVQEIANVDDYTGCRQWNKYSSQQSSPIHLTKGQYYYVEALHKEGGGGDSMSVGWRKPSDGSGSSPTEIVPKSALRTGLPEKPDIHVDNAAKGLVGHWKLNGNAKDSTPYGDYGTPQGGSALAADRKGQANSSYHFDGSSDIDFGTSQHLVLGPHFTESVWIKPEITDTAYHGVLGYGLAGSASRSPSIYVYDKTKIHTGFGDGNDWDSLITGPVLTENAWNYVVTTFDGTTYKVYVDGRQVYSTNDYAGVVPTNTPVRYAGRVDNFFIGSIDDVRLYDRALSPDEIKNLYSSYNSQIYLGGSGKPGSVSLGKGLVGRWKFHGNARDATPHSDNGTVHGATLTDDRFGRAQSAYNFGSGKYVSVPDADILDPTNITVSAWINPSTTSQTGNIVSEGGGSYRYRLTGNDTIQLLIYNTPIISSAATIPANQWSRVTFTGDSSGMKIYVNGQLSASTSDAYHNGNSHELYIGSYNGAGEFFQGAIDDVRIYNRALNSGEITALHNE
jgi:hypothetical protein